jgi:hypothetical protein
LLHCGRDARQVVERLHVVGTDSGGGQFVAEERHRLLEDPGYQRAQTLFLERAQFVARERLDLGPMELGHALPGSAAVHEPFIRIVPF